jgi:endonuclease/exonuclease/phosphatase family metal-dependent hydrolase
MIGAEILRHKADIIILTEFYKTGDYRERLARPLEESGYRVFEDPRPAKRGIRQVLIAVRAERVGNPSVTPVLLPDNDGHVRTGHFPNFMRIDIGTDSGPVSVIGARIRVWTNHGAEEQLRRRNQFMTLLEHLPEDRPVVMAGDFNISDHPGFRKAGSRWHFDIDYRNVLAGRGFSLHIPDNGCSPIRSPYRMDHLVVSDHLAVDQVIYYACDSWPVGEANHPDHAILLAGVRI